MEGRTSLQTAVSALVPPSPRQKCADVRPRTPMPMTACILHTGAAPTVLFTSDSRTCVPPHMIMPPPPPPPNQL